MTYKYTLCFIRDQSFGDDYLLLLKRNKEPNAGLYNGVGGKIKPGETPMRCILREVLEETEIALPDARFAGVVTWPEELNSFSNGMYVYVADWPGALPRSWRLLQSRETAEGRLQWLPTDRVCDPESAQIVSNIPYFLPAMLSGEVPPSRYHCTYNEHGVLDKVENSPLPQEVIEEVARVSERPKLLQEIDRTIASHLRARNMQSPETAAMFEPEYVKMGEEALNYVSGLEVETVSLAEKMAGMVTLEQVEKSLRDIIENKGNAFAEWLVSETLDHLRQSTPTEKE